MLQVPSAYRAGYEKARGFDAALADNYARHITMGDPELDPVMEELSSISPPQLHRFIAAGIEGQDEDLRKAPEPLRNFFKNLEDPPWLNHDAFRPGISTFGKNVTLMLTAFVTGVLVEGFSTLIAKSFNITGRVASGKRRLQQNNRHMMEIFYPLGLRRDGDGWKLSTRIRFAHSRVRSLLDKSRDWKHETWGLAGKRGAPGIRHLRFFHAPVGTLGGGGRTIHQRRNKERFGCLALRRISNGDT